MGLLVTRHLPQRLRKIVKTPEKLSWCGVGVVPELQLELRNPVCK